jgi:hypothetical protein
MNGSRNFRSFAGTLAAVAVALAGPTGCEGWALFNDHASNVYTFTIAGQAFKVNPGEMLLLPLRGDSATINGTGAYRAIAVDDVEALAVLARASTGSTAGQVLDGSVTLAKIVDAAFTAAAMKANGAAGGKFDSDAINPANADQLDAWAANGLDATAVAKIVAAGSIAEAKIGGQVISSATTNHLARVATFPIGFADIEAAADVTTFGEALPSGALITRAWYFVTQTFTSATDAATIGIGIVTDDVDGIVANVSISHGGNAWDAGGHEAIQDGTVANFANPCTAARKLHLTRGGAEALTAGAMVLCVEFAVVA